MEKIEAAFRVATPMFMGGADPERSKAELRLPSIKGVLRFWWRALAWERCGGDLGRMRGEENRLFGSTETGQAAVLMKLDSNNAPSSLSADWILRDERRNVVGSGTRYLGYGVVEAFASREKGSEAGQLIRPCLSKPFKFRVEFLLKPSIEAQLAESLIEAIKLLGLIGGAGSKSRKGYGSLTLTELKHHDETLSVPNDFDSIKAELENLRRGAAFPPFTALSEDTRFVIIEGYDNDSPLSLLNRIGLEMVFYRSWGQRGRVLDEDSECNFEADHDLMKRLPTNIRYPKRVAFGLPHNYGKGRPLEVKPAGNDRRGSPLFIHIHQSSGTGTPIAIISFIPSTFLPEGERLQSFGERVSPTYNNAFWKPVGDFLERLKGEHQGRPLERHEEFGKVVEV